MCKGISPGVGFPSIAEVPPHSLGNKGPVSNQGGKATEGSICKPAIYCAKEVWFSPTSGPLNNFIVKKRFKQQGDWMVFIDLKDAYLSVVVAEEYRGT